MPRRPPGRSFEVALVVLLGAVEGGRGHDLRDDPSPVLSLDALAGGQSRGLLLGGVKEDRRAVLAADVKPLAVSRRRVVDPPEAGEQIPIAHHRGVEPDLHRLGVAAVMTAHLPVGGIGRVTARVADRRLKDAIDLTERRLDPPEAARGEGRALCARGPGAGKGRREGLGLIGFGAGAF